MQIGYLMTHQPSSQTHQAGEQTHQHKSQTHQPKGSMCINCAKFPRCTAHGFERMPVIKVYPDGVKAVKCTDHQPINQPAKRA